MKFSFLLALYSSNVLLTCNKKCMLPACGDIFYLDVLPDKEIDCLGRIQVKSVIGYPCKLAMTSTAPGIANTLLLCDCNSMVEPTGNFDNLVFGQTINELRTVVRPRAVNTMRLPRYA